MWRLTARLSSFLTSCWLDVCRLTIYFTWILSLLGLLHNWRSPVFNPASRLQPCLSAMTPTRLQCNPTCTAPQFNPTSVFSQLAETFVTCFFVPLFLFPMGAHCAALIVAGYCTTCLVSETWSRLSGVILKCLYFCTLSQTLLFSHFIEVNMLSMLTYLGFWVFLFFLFWNTLIFFIYLSPLFNPCSHWRK